MAILNVVFMVVGFIALWADVRQAGLGFVNLLEFDLLAPTVFTDLSNIIGFGLIIFLAYTLVDVAKKAFPARDEEGSRDRDAVVTKMIQSAIIAFVIGIIQVLPSFTYPPLYEGWDAISPYVPILLLIVFSAAIFFLAFIYERIGRKTTSIYS